MKENAKGDNTQYLDSDDFVVKTKLEFSLPALSNSTHNIAILSFKIFSQNINNLRKPFCNLRMEYFNFENLLKSIQ